MAKLLNITVDGVGVPLIFEQDNRLPLVSMRLVFQNAGALTDVKAGLAKLSSKLLGEGTKEQGSIAFAAALESRAVSLSASVGAESFVMTLGSLKSEFGLGVASLRKLLDDPNYSDEAFSKIQSQTIGALTQKQSDFDFVASNQLKGMLFANTPREYPISGTVQSVESITLEDIKTHINTYLGYDRVIAIIGGDLSEDEAMSMVSDAIGGLAKVDTPAIQYINTSSEAIQKTIHAKTEQAYIYFGAPYDMAYDSDEVYLGKVAAFVLGSSGFGSRLMEEIRVKRGLAYSAYASLSVNKTASYFSGYLQTKLDSGDEAKKVVQEVVDEFIAHGITQEELDSAKLFLLGSEPLRTETLQQRVERAFDEYYMGRELGYKTQELKLIDDISLEQINKFIAKHTEIASISFSVLTAV